MALHTDIPRIAMQVSRGIVVASIQVDLNDDILAQLQEDLLNRVQETGSRGVILDVSGLETLDSEEFAALRRIIAMATLLGAESVLAGLRPGIVSALIETGAEVDGLRAAINLDAAFALLQPEPESEADSASEPETAADVGPECAPPLEFERATEADR
jgi:rsbT antagonist protein RsbS